MDAFTKTKNTTCETTCQAEPSLVCGNEKKRPKKQLTSEPPNQQNEDCFVYASTRVATRLILKILEFEPIIVETENATFGPPEMCRLRCASIADTNDPVMQYKIAYTHIQKYINDNVVNRFGCNRGYTSHVLVWIIVFLFKYTSDNADADANKRNIVTGPDDSSWDTFEDFKDEELKTLILNASRDGKFNYVVEPLSDEHYTVDNIFSELGGVLGSNSYATFSISAADPWWTTFASLTKINLQENSAQLAIKTCEDETDTHVVTIRRMCQNNQGLEIINSWGVDWANKGTFCFTKAHFDGITDYTILFYQNYEQAENRAINFTNDIIRVLESEIKTIDALGSPSQDDTQKDEEHEGGKSRTHKRRRPVKSRKNMRKKARAQNKRTRKLHRNRRRNHTRAKLLSR